ncbi:hypothetical protein [Lyngbya aestuarii]|uniref:hypothetical protein n=1 Tax=Lyngbya aestuarii TaxID=118322 RepID=UPI00403DC1B6
MKTATPPDNLKVLGNILEKELVSKLSKIASMQVLCQVLKGTLVIVVEHPAAVKPDPHQTFSVLEQAILTRYRSVSQKVKIYLRVAGQQQPYTSYSFMVKPPESSTASATTNLGATDADKFAEIPTAKQREDKLLETESIQNKDTQTTTSVLPQPWDLQIPGSESQEKEGYNNQQAQSSEQFLPAEETPTPTKAKFKRSLLPLIAVGTGLSVLVFCLTFYMLSRPCVMGACEAIPEADELSQQSATTLRNPQSGKEVLAAQEQMMRAIQILESIPVWSKNRAQAQELLKTYRASLTNVNEMVLAMQTAARAAYKGQNPPHPPSRWIEIQGFWREAIARLEQLPSDSSLQPLAQQKIKEYQSKLAQINQRLVKERQSDGKLQAAKDAAQIAEARQGVAQTLPHWQLVYATWQTALKRLREIPQGTTAYQEAQQLSALYQPKIASVRDRKTQEKIAANAYNQAIRLAQLAKQSQEQNQWSATVKHWRNALTYAKQVSNNTFYYTKAQSLIDSYNSDLKQAQNQLQYAVKVQQTRDELNQVCSGKIKVCDYNISNNIIKVQLTPSYLEIVKKTALTAQVSGNSAAHAGIVNHVLTLEEALAAISNNFQMRLEVYTPDGVLVEIHSPGS